MRRYFYLIDGDGNELPGSRRYLDHCRDWRDVLAVENGLRAVMGEDCELRDSALDESRVR
ncbi:MAG: hypothetical protein KDE63_01230 [Novosphingobium sp.]|nr:hypothetical protein [Novosphingobium sp.]